MTQLRCFLATSATLLLAVPASAAEATASSALEHAITQEIDSLRLSRPKRILKLSCVEALMEALQHNFDIQITTAQKKQTEALRDSAWGRFDPYFLGSANARKYRYPTVRFLDVGGLSGIEPVTDVKVNPGLNRTFRGELSGTLHLGTTYSLSMEGQREDTPRSGWFGMDPRHSLLVNLTITQPLLRGAYLDYNLADARQGENNVAIAQATLEEQVADVVAAVEKAYWNLVYAKEKLRVQEGAYREARTFLAVTEARNAVGYQASELDVIGARAQVETRKYELIQAHADYLAARDELLILMNSTGDRTSRPTRIGPDRLRIEEIQLEPTSNPAVEVVEVRVDEALACAFRRRPLYLSYQYRLRNQQIEIERRRNELLPELNLVAEWNQHGLERTLSNAFDEMGTGKYYTRFLGAQLQVPLFNITAKARLREAEAALQQLQLEKRKLENSLVADVVKAVRELRAAAWQVKSTQAAVKYARKQLQGEKRKLASGTSTSYTVLQMQNDVLAAELNALQAVVSYRTALVDLERAKGTLLGRYNIRVR